LAGAFISTPVVALVYLLGGVRESTFLVSLTIAVGGVGVMLFILYKSGRLRLSSAAAASLTAILAWTWCLNTLPIDGGAITPVARYGVSVVVSNKDGNLSGNQSEAIVDWSGRQGLPGSQLRWTIGRSQDTFDFIGVVWLGKDETVRITFPIEAVVHSAKIEYAMGDAWTSVDPGSVAKLDSNDQRGAGGPLFVVWQLAGPQDWDSPRFVSYRVKFETPPSSTAIPIAKSRHTLQLDATLPTSILVEASETSKLQAVDGGVLAGNIQALSASESGARMIDVTTVDNPLGYFSDVAGGLLAATSGYFLGAVTSAGGSTVRAARRKK